MLLFGSGEPDGIVRPSSGDTVCAVTVLLHVETEDVTNLTKISEAVLPSPEVASIVNDWYITPAKTKQSKYYNNQNVPDAYKVSEMLAMFVTPTGAPNATLGLSAVRKRSTP